MAQTPENQSQSKVQKLLKKFMEQLQKSNDIDSKAAGLPDGVAYNADEGMFDFDGDGKPDKAVWPVKFALLCLVGLALALVQVNAEPYVGITSGWLNGRGWMLMPAATAAWTLGLGLWFIIQLFEIGSTFMLHNKRFILAVIANFYSSPRLKNLDGDSPEIRALKQRFNATYLDVIIGLEVARAIAYTVDVVLVMWKYPPLKGGINSISYFLTTWDFSLIDFDQLQKALTAVFLMEVFYHAGRLLVKVVYLLSKSYQTQAQN
ncbi:hypothetical protein IQ266_25095 [filamentous cyanobacterium LEGE 11480]|uniref:Uncharacterized protein n=1 Tax=Romeriopsis navalis LEGE 11480 TaxID=2777977 RepID=A0A928Z6H4_9CYAN|nr:hypothetical protein [Romeriopsis navalis]MBE9033017.1 hypothetical protein [Romeriopsis navalis LEGE 11480]